MTTVAANSVCFYTKPNQEGNRACIDVDDGVETISMDLTKNGYKGLFNNKVKSIEGEGFDVNSVSHQVLAYNWGNFRRFISVAEDLNDIDISGVSSFLIVKQPTNANQVCFYPNKNFQGERHCLDAGIHNELEPHLNDNIASVLFGENVQSVKLFGRTHHRNGFLGQTKILSDSTNNLGLYNNRASSLLIELNTSPTATSSPTATPAPTPTPTPSLR